MKHIFILVFIWVTIFVYTLIGKSCAETILKVKLPRNYIFFRDKRVETKQKFCDMNFAWKTNFIFWIALSLIIVVILISIMRKYFLMKMFFWKLIVNKLLKTNFLANITKNLPSMNLKILRDILDNNCYKFQEWQDLEVSWDELLCKICEIR